MDMKLNSMNNVYHKTPNGVSKVIASFNVADTKNTISVSEQKSDKSDKVEISHAATQKYEIHKITQSIMKDINAVDMNEKVEDIKTKIENNTYEVSPEKIANSILSRWAM